MRVQQNSARLVDVAPAPIFSNAAAGCADPAGMVRLAPVSIARRRHRPPGIGLTMTNDKPPRIVYAKPPRTARRKAPPARVTIPAVILTARKPRKLDTVIRYARMLQKPDIEAP